MTAQFEQKEPLDLDKLTDNQKKCFCLSIVR